MASWLQMVRVSYSKILAKFCGVNHFLNQIFNGMVDAKYPCYPLPDETTEHIILCKNTARTRLDHDAVDKLGQWMTSQQTDSLITTMILKYLKARKRLTMYKCYKGSQSLTLMGWILAKAHDRLGWRNFVEGRIAGKYEYIQCNWYQKIESRRLSQKRAAEFIAKLVRITNNQWT